MKFSGLFIRAYNPVKNGIQYSIGALLYFLFFGSFDITKFLIGLIGFVIAYQSVYQFNDLMDYESDRKDKVRREKKPLARGDASRKDVESYSYILSVIGLSICFFVNPYFGILVSATLFLNFLHSSHFVRLKESKLLLPNLFFIEFLKYSIGWFAFSIAISEFPFLLITLFSFIYVGCYIFWKQNLNNFLGNAKLKIITGISVMLYIASVFVYQFTLILIIPIPLAVLCVFLRNHISGRLKKINIDFSLAYITFFYIVISLLILTIPAVATVNVNINQRMDTMKESIKEALPETLKSDIDNINHTLKQNIDKIDGLIRDQPFYWQGYVGLYVR